jgi:hypothetical protein
MTLPDTGEGTLLVKYIMKPMVVLVAMLLRGPVGATAGEQERRGALVRSWDDVMR